MSHTRGHSLRCSCIRMGEMGEGSAGVSTTKVSKAVLHTTHPKNKIWLCVWTVGGYRRASSLGWENILLTGISNGLSVEVSFEGQRVLPAGARRRRPGRCRANMAHIRQSRPDSGRGFQVEVLKTYQVVPSSRRSGPGRGSGRWGVGSWWGANHLIPCGYWQ